MVQAAPRKRKSSINAPRLSYPNYLRKDGKGIAEEYKRYVEELELCRGLVTIARTVLNRPDLELIFGGPKTKPKVIRPETDGTHIWIPQLHPRRVQCTKHELAHIYFMSDLELRHVFAKDMLNNIEQQSGRKLSAKVYETLIECISFIVNIFDDIRVNSLWGLLYPGDGEDFDNWYHDELGPRLKRKALKEFGDDIPNLFTYIILISIGQEAESSTWGEFQDDILQAACDVHYKAFGASLFITRDLIRRIAERVLKTLPDKPPPAWGNEPRSGGGDVNAVLQARTSVVGDLTRALEEMAKFGSPEELNDDNAGFDYKSHPQDDPGNMRRAKAALKALEQGDNDLQNFLNRQEKDGVAMVDGIRNAMAKLRRRRDDDEHLGKGSHIVKNFIRVPRRDLRPIVLSQEELDEAAGWRAYFNRVMGLLSMETDIQGGEMQMDLYVQQRIMRQPLDCFTVEAAGRGFRLVLLVDMSQSMIHRFQQVEKLSAVLQKALDFPFVYLDVVGFNSLDGKAVDVYLYPSKPEGLISPQSITGGLTPLPSALHVAGQRLASSQDDNHIFLISDGWPMQLDRRGILVNKSALIDLTAEAVQLLRSKSINTWCFMIGGDVPHKYMSTMFGEERWREIHDHSLFQDSFDFILQRFLRFLRSR
jgi:hypothetical protein